jgi:hypothetical protein
MNRSNLIPRQGVILLRRSVPCGLDPSGSDFVNCKADRIRGLQDGGFETRAFPHVPCRAYPFRDVLKCQTNVRARVGIGRMPKYNIRAAPS